MIGVPVTIVTSMLLVPADHWSAPLDFAPAKVDASFSSATCDCGNQSPVNLQTVAIINVPGPGNRITWVKGPSGGVPQISNSGGSNSIAGPGGIQIQSGR
jgi:hypothetical protein